MAKDPSKKKNTSSKEKKDSSQGSPKEAGSTLSAEDLDRTVLDIDLKALEEAEKEKERAQPPESAAKGGELDETVMVSLSDLEEQGLLEEEKTSVFSLEEGEEKEKGKEKEKKEVPKKPAVQEKSKSKKEKPKTKPPKKGPKQPKGFLGRVGAIFYLFLSVLGFSYLVLSAIDVLRRGPVLRWQAYGVLAFAVLIPLVGFLKKIGPKRIFAGLLLLIVAWNFAALSKTFSSEVKLFSFLTLEVLLAPLLILVLAFWAWECFRSRDHGWGTKGLSLVGLLLVLLSAIIAWTQGLSLEGALWGPQWMASWPLFLRSGVLGLGWALVFFVLSALLGFFKGLHQGLPRARLVGAYGLALSLLTLLLGFSLMARQGYTLPFLGFWAEKDLSAFTSMTVEGRQYQWALGLSRENSGLETKNHLSAFVSQPYGKKESLWEAVLALKNPQGRAYVASNLNSLSQMITSGSSVKKFRMDLLKDRLGQSKTLALVLPSVETLSPDVQRALALSILRLTAYLGDQEELWVSNLKDEVVLKVGETQVRKRLAPLFKKEPNKAKPLSVSAFLQRLAKRPGVRQLLWVSSWSDIPNQEQVVPWKTVARSERIYLNFLALGKKEANLKEKFSILYEVQDPTQLGHQLLSASALSLGDYRLLFESKPAKVDIELEGLGKEAESFSEDSLSFLIKGLKPKEIEWVELKEVGRRLKKWSPVTEALQLDLGGLAWKDGRKDLVLEIRTLTGERFEKSFSFFYVSKQPLEFIKPLNQDFLQGRFQVRLAPGRRPGLGTESIELYLNGESVGSATTEPFIIPLDTKKFAAGDYELQAVQKYSDGSNETQSIQVRISDKAPEVRILRPSQGEFLGNLVEIEAQVKADLFEPVQRVEFFVNGRLLGEVLQPPYRFLWSNEDLPVGSYFIQARAFLNDQRSATDAVKVKLGQALISVQADKNTQGKLFPDRVEVLVDASASMRESLGKALKIDIVDLALLEIRRSLPTSVNWLVRSYGESSSTFQEQCQDSSLLKQKDLEKGFFPQGTSNLAYALRQVPQDLKNYQGSKVALLFTDGWDACGEDPLKAISEWVRKAGKLRLYVLYLGDAQSTDASLLARLAEITGGSLYVVRDLESLRQALEEAVQVHFSLINYKNEPVLEQSLSSKSYRVKAGSYRLEVETDPAIRLEEILLNPGSKKTFWIEEKSGRYQLIER